MREVTPDDKTFDSYAEALDSAKLVIRTFKEMRRIPPPDLARHFFENAYGKNTLHNLVILYKQDHGMSLETSAVEPKERSDASLGLVGGTTQDYSHHVPDLVGQITPEEKPTPNLRPVKRGREGGSERSEPLGELAQRTTDRPTERTVLPVGKAKKVAFQDFLGNTVRIGDIVVFPKTASQLTYGKVVGMTNTRAQIQIPDEPIIAQKAFKYVCRVKE